MKQDNDTSRRKFLRLLSLGGAGICLTNCTNSVDKNIATQKSAVTDKLIESTPKPTPAPSSGKLINSKNVTFYQKGDEAYEQLRHGHNKRIDKYPAAIALCLNEQGVQEALQLAALNNWAVAIKSSGHSLEGFSVNNGGMVINLSKLNQIEWLNNNEVKLGPACKLSQLYDEMLPKGRLIPGGSCGGVAIGGLTLGGGYGLFSRKYGLTCDSLLSVSMIDGTGRKITSQDDPELLWACRGGGAGNFGVITEMKFRTQPAPATLTSHRFRKFKTDAQTAAAIMEQWFTLTTALPETCFSVFILNGKTVFILLTNFGPVTKPVKEMIEQLSALTDKPSLGNPSKLSAAVKIFYGIQEPTFYKNSSAGLYKNYADIRDFIVPVLEKISATPGMILSIGTLGGEIGNAELAATAAFPHRAYNYLSELQAYWSKPAQEKKLVTAYGEIRDAFQSHGIKTQYINYPDLGYKDWEHAYYGDNYARLQEIKKRYDPKDLIRHEQSVRLK